MIAKKFSTNHHKIKRILIKNNIEIDNKNRIRKNFSKETRKKMSDSAKKRDFSSYNGKKHTTERKIKNMATHLKYNVTTEWLKKFDFEKLKYLNNTITKERYKIGFNTNIYMNFIEKFYNDNKFNILYEKWIESNDKWIKPSLDHIKPISKGGEVNNLNNLQFISWFENKAKHDMEQKQWNKMKKNIEKYF